MKTNSVKDTKMDNFVGNSKAIITNQSGIHEKLDEVVQKHLTHPFQKPFQAHTQKAFDEVNALVQEFLVEKPDGKVILDSCCGVGQSSRLLAKLNPEALIIGVDKSADRIERKVEGFDLKDGFQADNYRLVRADLNDFYRLVQAAKWPVFKHYILYPNPWPKSKHLQRRWHGSAVFPTLISLGEQIVLRSNWRLYLEEFQQAAKLVNLMGSLTELSIEKQPLTPFEAKYQASGQVCWQLTLKR